MYHVVEPGPAGVWSWYGTDARQIAAHAEAAGGPVTVFWGGEVGGARLKDFVAAAVPALPSGAVRHGGYRTVVLTDHEEIQLASEIAPVFPDHLAQSAGFVRFEYDVPSPGAATAPALIAWARLDHPPADQIDSIGVYGSIADLVSIKQHLARLVSETSFSRLAEGFVSEVLGRLESDLANGAKAALAT
jgi:hypothetical protein